MAIAFFFVPMSVSAHPVPGALPAVPDFDVRWFQNPDPHEIQDWDIEITPFDTRYDPRIVQATPFPDEISCWRATVPAESPAMVRIRAVQDGAVSVWSAYTAVPEPLFGFSLAVGGLALTLLRGHRSGISRSGREASSID